MAGAEVTEDNAEDRNKLIENPMWRPMTGEAERKTRRPGKTRDK